MPHRRIIQLASELRDAQGENVNDQTRWVGLVAAVRQLLPNSALSQQDQLARMTRKANEPWMDFVDRYGLFAATCTQVTEAVKTAELFRKLPRELRVQLSHIKHETTLTAMREAVCGVRY